MIFAQKDQLISNGKSTELIQKREHVLSILSTVLKAVDPYNAVKSRIEDSKLLLKDQKIDSTQFNNIYVLAFGKGSVGMTQAACDMLPIKQALAITNDPQGSINHENAEVIIGGHPVPNEQSIFGAKKAQELLSFAHNDDLVLILISGGGSALLTAPRISLKDLQETTKLLLASGATIQEINTIRKHVSTVKGGQLIRSLDCQVMSFIVSDVVGDPFEFIASGPTVGDSTTFTDAIAILKKYDLWEKVPESTRKIIEQGKNGILPETPFPHDHLFDNVSNEIIANNSLACETALLQAKNLGYKPVLFSNNITGEAKEIGPQLIEKARKIKKDGKGNVFIAGGETTVTLQGEGKGGRNQELVLSVVEMIEDTTELCCSFGTDGIDGMSPAAGAIADGNSKKRAITQNMAIDTYLKNNDSYTFFNNLNDTIITGPTGTNVMDIQIIML